MTFLHKKRILVADDEAIVRRQVNMMLGTCFTVEEAALASEVRERPLQSYDAVLLDIVFPDGNGIDVCAEIKADHPHLTVVISSSLESVDAWNKAFAAGADYYLEKRELISLDPRKIRLTLENLIERNALRKQAEERNRRQGELLSVLSHDVRAPFQALLGTIEKLRKSDIPAEAADNVEDLHQCAKDQLGFINSLLELLRLESGAVRLRPRAVDINLPVSQCLQGLKVLAENKDIHLKCSLEPKLPRIEGDIGKVSQVVSNLVSNAIKFTPRHGSVTVETRACEVAGRPGAEIVVVDTGAGLDDGIGKLPTERFSRGRAAGTEGERGTGLGLSICNEIVQLHGGLLELESAQPCGTKARVWLPCELTVYQAEAPSGRGSEASSGGQWVEEQKGDIRQPSHVSTTASVCC